MWKRRGLMMMSSAGDPNQYYSSLSSFMIGSFLLTADYWLFGGFNGLTEHYSWLSVIDFNLNINPIICFFFPAWAVMRMMRMIFDCSIWLLIISRHAKNRYLTLLTIISVKCINKTKQQHVSPVAVVMTDRLNVAYITVDVLFEGSRLT